MPTDILTAVSSPAEAGVPYAAIHRFLDVVAEQELKLHGFVMMRGNKVFAEGYYAPFHKDFMHRMYSVSKSFSAAAVGLLAGQGKISLDDRVATYFPDKISENLHPYVAEATIRDLLRMASCYSGLTYGRYCPDWTKSFFQPELYNGRYPTHRVGTKFLYDTCAPLMCDAIVERVTGQPFMTYLVENALGEIGFSSDAWCVAAPEGYSWGGSGVVCTTRDLARFITLLKNGGRVGDRQLLPADFVKAATSKQIDNSNGPINNPLVKGNGYGYQIWITKENGFAALGMGSQIGWALPDKDVVVAMTADTQGDGRPGDAYALATAFKECVYDAIGEPYAPDPAEEARLTARLEALTFPHQKGAKHAPMQAVIANKTYMGNEDPAETVQGILSMSFTFDGDEGAWHYRTSRGDKVIPFGIGFNKEIRFPETHYYDKRITEAGGREFYALSSAAWTADNQLTLRVWIADSCVGNMTAVFDFADDALSYKMTKTAEFFLDEYDCTGTATLAE
ncbi:MAG: serine hydrolase [Clostridia bacterium]|nr:serine hydrolase [Clostridia bacterium]